MLKMQFLVPFVAATICAAPVLSDGFSGTFLFHQNEENFTTNLFILNDLHYTKETRASQLNLSYDWDRFGVELRYVGTRYSLESEDERVSWNEGVRQTDFFEITPKYTLNEQHAIGLALGKVNVHRFDEDAETTVPYTRIGLKYWFNSDRFDAFAGYYLIDGRDEFSDREIEEVKLGSKFQATNRVSVFGVASRQTYKYQSEKIYNVSKISLAGAYDINDAWRIWAEIKQERTDYVSALLKDQEVLSKRLGVRYDFRNGLAMSVAIQQPNYRDSFFVGEPALAMWLKYDFGDGKTSEKGIHVDQVTVEKFD